MAIDIGTLRVLETGDHPGVAFCGMLLAGLGADVIRYGAATYEEAGAQIDLLPGERPISATALYLDRDKQCFAEALSAEEVPGVGTDLLITNLPAHAQAFAASERSPGQARVAGLLTHDDDDVGVWSIPDGDGAEIHVMALGGLLHMIGDAARHPIRLGGLQAAYAGGLALFTGMFVAAWDAAATAGTATVRTSSVRAVRYVDWKTQIHHEGDRTRLARGSSTGPFVLPCVDGFVGFYYRTEEWEAVKALFADPRLEDERFSTQPGRDSHRADLLRIVSEHSRGMRKQDLYEAAQQREIPAGAVRTLDELLDDPQYAARQFIASGKVPGLGDVRWPRVPWTVNGARATPSTRGGDAPAEPSANDRPAPGSLPTAGLPLNGLRVLDLSGITAGGRTTQLLADFGADVVKVESGTRPDPFRHWSGVTGVVGEGDLDSPPFRAANRNKRGIAVDLKTEEGRDLLARLVARSDIVVENFRRGVMERLGLGLDRLLEWNPSVVLFSITSQGETGPESRNKSFGGTLEALGGLMSLTGYGPDTPTWSTSKVNYPDQVVALLAPGLALWAVDESRRTGRGMHVDLSQRELVTALLGGELLATAATGNAHVPRANARPFGMDLCLPCAGDDEWVVVTLRNWDDVGRLASHLGAEGEATSVQGRPGVPSELSTSVVSRLEAWCADRSRQDAAEQLRDLGLTATPVLRAWEIAASSPSHVAVPGPDDVGTETQVSWPFRIEGREGDIRCRAPHLGEHTREVMRELGIDGAAVDALVSSGVLAETLST